MRNQHTDTYGDIKMARQVIKKTRKRKTGGSSGYIQCNMCHGTGRVRDRRNKKKT